MRRLNLCEPLLNFFFLFLLLSIYCRGDGDWAKKKENSNTEQVIIMCESIQVGLGIKRYAEVVHQKVRGQNLQKHLFKIEYLVINCRKDVHFFLIIW